MKNVFGPLQPSIYALFRIIFGLIYFQHGTQKYFGWPSAMPGHLPTLMRVAGVIELACGFCIMVGLFAEYAAFLASGEMACAYFIAHFPHGFWPLTNHGETPVLLCFAFLFMATRGAGEWSVDSVLRRSPTPFERRFFG